MVEFILVACLAGEPDRCRTESRLLTETTLIQCMTGTQFLAADWARDHPGWEVQKHRCGIVDRTAAQL